MFVLVLSSWSDPKAAKVIMLICVFIFETEGLDEGSWIKVLNLMPGPGFELVAGLLRDYNMSYFHDLCHMQVLHDSACFNTYQMLNDSSEDCHTDRLHLEGVASCWSPLRHSTSGDNPNAASDFLAATIRHLNML